MRLPRDAGSDSVDVQDCGASLLRGGALLQCGPNVAHFVACWEMWVVDPASGPSGMPLLCMRSPWDSTVWEVRSSSTESTPAEIGDPVAGARPWGLRLADGQRCEIRSGGAWGMPPAGYVFTYSCTGGMLLMEPEDGSGIDRSAARWKVHTYRADTATAGTAQVAEAMFAGPTWQRSLPTCPSDATLNAAAQPNHAVKSGFPKSCAGNWAVMAVYEKTDPSKMPRPASFASAGGSWTADYTPASTFCTSWTGKPLPLLIWCYVS